MKSFFKVLASEKKDAANENSSDIGLIIEVIIVTFLVSIIPQLIIIGRIPTPEEIYVPVLSAILMAIYAYIRIRDIDVETTTESN